MKNKKKKKIYTHKISLAFVIIFKNILSKWYLSTRPTMTLLAIILSFSATSLDDATFGNCLRQAGL
jgi:hypothetical protein